MRTAIVLLIKPFFGGVLVALIVVGLLELPINKRVGLIILACHVHQKALRSMGCLVIKAIDEKLCNKSNKKISFGCINPDFCFALFSLAHARHFYPVIQFANRIA